MFSPTIQSLSLRQKVDRKSAKMTSSGKLFQSWATAIKKVRLPTVDSLTGGSTRRLELDDDDDDDDVI